jgi:predicted RNA-binding Zn-ribbon protein involved in translation (DUF1610 family)
MMLSDTINGLDFQFCEHSGVMACRPGNDNGRKRHKCPNCGKRSLVKTGASHYGADYDCYKCGAHALIEREWELPPWDEKGTR